MIIKFAENLKDAIDIIKRLKYPRYDILFENIHSKVFAQYRYDGYEGGIITTRRDYLKNGETIINGKSLHTRLKTGK